MHVQELDVLFTVALWLVKKSNQFNHIYIAEKKGRNQNRVSHRGLTVQTCIQSDHPLNCQVRVKKQ